MTSKAAALFLVLAVVAPWGTVAQTCSNGLAGIEDENACCVLECGLCGGLGCGAALTGANDGPSCCSSEILAAGVLCDDTAVPPVEAPCIVAPTLDPTATCSNGLAGYEDGAACCAPTCGQCGGVGCGTIFGTNGGTDCCSSEIELAGEDCDVTGAAPCVIVPVASPTDFCSNGLAGIQDGNACCEANCGQCGGVGCGVIAGTGGASSCCSTTIETSGESCSVTGAAPCIIESDAGPSTCFNGLPGVSDGNVCCVEACGQCGGVGCGSIVGTGGAEECCSSVIAAANMTCGVDTVTAPCVMPLGSFTFAPTAAPTAAPSALPSAAPTAVPSVMPTAVPSTMPTAVPSTMPTAVPSTMPTAVPSTMPSAAPSSAPVTATMAPTPGSRGGLITPAPTGATIAPEETDGPTPSPTTEDGDRSIGDVTGSFAPSTSPTSAPATDENADDRDIVDGASRTAFSGLVAVVAVAATAALAVGPRH